MDAVLEMVNFPCRTTWFWHGGPDANPCRIMNVTPLGSQKPGVVPASGSTQTRVGRRHGGDSVQRSTNLFDVQVPRFGPASTVCPQGRMSLAKGLKVRCSPKLRRRLKRVFLEQGTRSETLARNWVDAGRWRRGLWPLVGGRLSRRMPSAQQGGRRDVPQTD